MKTAKYIGIILAAGISAALLFAAYAYAAVHKPILAADPVFFTVKTGASVSSVAAELEERGVIPSAFMFRLAASFAGSRPIQAADYEIAPGTSIVELYRNFADGRSISPERQVTLVEGWTLRQIAEHLAKEGIVADADAFIQAASNNVSRFANEFPLISSIPDGDSLEGYLFPDTYRFFPGSEPDAVIRRLLSNFQLQVQPLLGDGARGDRSLHDMVILASIVEREVRSHEEMKTVAGIFTNRLRDGMALQADSTINYVTSSGRARSTYDDLLIDSPYNTYKYAGLPKGPISNPGRSALTAAFSPAQTPYYFFLTDPAGRVYYAEDLDGHNYNRRYL